VEIAHAAILRMHMLAGRDGLGGKADDLAVAGDRLAARDRLDRDLVARWNPLGRGHALRHHHAGRQAGARDQHAVVRMQADDGCRSHLKSPLQGANSEWRIESLPIRYSLFAIRLYAFPPESLRVALTCILA